MKVIETGFEGLFVIEPQVFEDNRGYFFESFSLKKFTELTGLTPEFVQDNESKSSYGVVRGLHFQREPYSQAKLVRCVEGRVLDVVVDLRKGSNTFGKHFSIEITGDNHLQLYIPKGFAHGFAVLSESAVFQYKCDEYYHPESEDGIYLLDKELDINWKIPETDMILSVKDSERGDFREYLKNNS